MPTRAHSGVNLSESKGSYPLRFSYSLHPRRLGPLSFGIALIGSLSLEVSIHAIGLTIPWWNILRVGCEAALLHLRSVGQQHPRSRLHQPGSPELISSRIIPNA